MAAMLRGTRPLPDAILVGGSAAAHHAGRSLIPLLAMRLGAAVW
jgi:hypothetical protein